MSGRPNGTIRYVALFAVGLPRLCQVAALVTASDLR